MIQYTLDVFIAQNSFCSNTIIPRCLSLGNSSQKCIQCAHEVYKDFEKRACFFIALKMFSNSLLRCHRKEKAQHFE